jgi:MFS family permease
VANSTTSVAAEHTRPLAAVFSATFFVRFAFGITVAVFASYILGRSSGLGQGDVGTVGLVSALAPIGEFSTVLLSGIAADRYGRFPVLFSGMAGAAALFAGVSTTRSPLVLGGLNLLFGLASGAILAASLAIVADRSGADERGLEMGRFDAMNLFGWVAGFAFGLGTLGAVANARLPYAFLAGAALLVAGLALAAVLVRGLPLRQSRQGIAVREVLGQAFRRGVLLVTLPWLVIYMLIGTALVFLGTAANGAGIAPVDLALVIGGGGLTLVVTQPYFGRLADRRGRMKMMTVGTVGFVLLMVLASLLVAFGPKPELLGGLGVSVLVALTYGPAALAALADLTVEMSRATTMAIYSLTISLGMVSGLLISTQLYARLGNVGLYLFFGGVAVTLVALTLARYRVLTTGPGTAVTTPVR